jgi:hypothetical protein
MVEQIQITQTEKTSPNTGSYHRQNTGLYGLMAAIASLLLGINQMQGAFAELTTYITKQQAYVADNGQKILDGDLKAIQALSADIASGKYKGKDLTDKQTELANLNTKFGLDQTDNQTRMMKIKPGLEVTQGLTGQLGTAAKSILDMSPLELIKFVAGLLR